MAVSFSYAPADPFLAASAVMLLVTVLAFQVPLRVQPEPAAAD